MLIVWLQLNIPGSRPVLARKWHELRPSMRITGTAPCSWSSNAACRVGGCLVRTAAGHTGCCTRLLYGAASARQTACQASVGADACRCRRMSTPSTRRKATAKVPRGAQQRWIGLRAPGDHLMRSKITAVRRCLRSSVGPARRADGWCVIPAAPVPVYRLLASASARSTFASAACLVWLWPEPRR